MLKRGYSNGERIIEIVEGNVDLVLYNDKGTSFYFYRFAPDEVIEGLSEAIPKNGTIVSQGQVKELFSEYGKNDYLGLINELLVKAVDENLAKRDEM